MPGFGKSGTSRISFFSLSIYKVVREKLPFDAKGRICLVGVEHNFLDVLDARVSRSRSQIMFESLDRTFRSLSECFDSPVIKISHIAADLMSCSGTLGEISIADTLDLPPDKKLPCDHNIFIRVRRGIPSAAAAGRYRPAFRGASIYLPEFVAAPRQERENPSARQSQTR